MCAPFLGGIEPEDYFRGNFILILWPSSRRSNGLRDFSASSFSPFPSRLHYESKPSQAESGAHSTPVDGDKADSGILHIPEQHHADFLLYRRPPYGFYESLNRILWIDKGDLAVHQEF